MSGLIRLLDGCTKYEDLIVIVFSITAPNKSVLLPRFVLRSHFWLHKTLELEGKMGYTMA